MSFGINQKQYSNATTIGHVPKDLSHNPKATNYKLKAKSDSLEATRYKHTVELKPVKQIPQSITF